MDDCGGYDNHPFDSHWPTPELRNRDCNRCLNSGNNQEPPVFEETDCLKKCPSCSFPVAINDNNRGCNRVICFRINCQTEFCRYCKKISHTNSRHMRCECQR